MNKIAIVTLSIVIGLMVLVSLAVAQVTTSCIPQPQCPDCVVTCEATVCPQCPTLNCSPTSNVLPGLWQVRFKNGLKCGVVTVYPDQMIIEDQYKGLTWLLVDKRTIMQQVDSCE